MHAGDRTLAELLWQRAEERPDAVVQSFTDGEGRRESLDLGRLARRADAFAAGLIERAEPGARVVLALEPGLGFVEALFGCFVAGLVAVPIPPPRTLAGEGLERLAAIVRDAAPTLVLGDRELARRGNESLPGPQWLDVDSLAYAGLVDRPRLRAGPDQLALLQYTSGSTGDPRGVCLSHANVLANLAAITDAFALEPGSVGVSWLPHFHDMGLIGTILAPVYVGFAMHRMAPETFLARPVRWLEAITEHRASVAGGPDFGFGLCCQAIPEAALAGVDLSSWKVAFVGAEPVRPTTLASFTARFATRGFDARAWLPCYGLAESTLFVTGVAVDEAPPVTRFDARALAEGRVVALPDDARSGHPLVGCGAPRSEPRVAIIDPEGSERASGELGEIAVVGASVSAGYFGRPRAEGWLRTGDLGFIHAGQLYVTGRLKDLIIVRGRNLYPQDIEARAARHGPPIRPGRAAAFALESADGERAVLVQEVRGESPPSEGWAGLAEALRVAIGESFEFELDALALVAAGEVPLTSSGKVRRSTCRDHYLDGRLRVLALARARVATTLELPDADTLVGLPSAVRRERITEALARWLEQRAGRTPEPDQPLAQLGLDSLILVELATAIDQRFGVSLGLAALLDQDLSQLAATLDVASESISTSSSSSTGEGESTDVSSGEAGFWHASRVDPDDTADLIARAAWVEGEIDERALGSALDSLVLDWAGLRSEFVIEAETLVRRQSPARSGNLHVEHLPAADRAALLAWLQARALEPMSLDRGPLIRAWLVRGRDALLFGITVHHVLVDDASLQQLGRALGLRHRAARAGLDPRTATPPRAIEAAAFAREQALMLASPRGLELGERWRERLSGLARARTTELGSRPAVAERRTMGPGSALRLDALARRLGGSRFATLLSLSAALLVRLGLGESERACLATPADLRTSGRFRGALGYLVNLLPIVVELDGELGFDQLAARVRTALAEALADQDFPYAQMQIVQPGFEPSLVLTFQPAELGEPGLSAWAAGLDDVMIDLPGLHLRTAPLATRHAQFPLHLAVVAREGRLTLVATADARRHDRVALQGLLEAFECALEALDDQPALAVDALPITRHVPLAQLGPSSDARPVLARISEVAARSPDAVAVVSGTRSLGYAGLLRAARALADRLRRRGVEPEQRVGLCLPRGPELVVAILAVFEVGAAYVPLELRLPDERLRALVELSGCVVVLCGSQHASLFGPELALRIETTPSLEPALPVDRRGQHPASLACVLFTSGSTGEPKGVAITRLGVDNLLAWASADQGEWLRGRTFAGTGIGFDLSLFELLGPLVCGGTVVLGADPLDLPRGAGIELLNTVPSIAAALLEHERVPTDLRAINLAGEPLGWGLVDALRARAPRAVIHDLYGPTETTTYSTGARVFAGPASERDTAPTIGVPIHATRCVLLDGEQRALPQGWVAELHIGGAGLARGYLDRPAETAARFVPDPSGSVGARIYRTGDRVRLDDQGQLHYLGRRDRQLKLAGVRIEPGEIEAVLARHPGVAQVAVQLDTSGRLVAHVGVGVGGGSERPSADLLRRFASERLPAAMVPAAIMVLDVLPRTARGKLDRAALAMPSGLALDEPLDHQPPRNQLERELCQLWATQLRIERVGIHDDFFALGGHSLAATILLATLQDRYAVTLRIRELYERPTIAALAEAITAAVGSTRTTIPARPDRRRWPLSPEQVRMWLADRVAPTAAAYNMPLVLRWRGPWAPERVARALVELGERHPILRTTIEQTGALPEQVVGPALVLEIARLGEPLELLAAHEAERPFELTREPPLRARLIRLADDEEVEEVEQVLLLTIHHLAADEQALMIVVESLAASLGLLPGSVTGNEPPLAALEFGDFASWQRTQFEGPAFDQRRASWASALADLQPLELPTDRPRRLLRSGAAGRIEFELPATTVDRLDALALELHASRFAIVTAALGLVCARWTGQLDVPLATPISQRGLPGLADAVGLLLETSILRVQTDRAATVRELIGQVRDTILAAIDRGPLPLERIAGPDSAGLVRVLVTVRSELALRLGALAVHEQVRPTAKAELTLAVSEREGRLLAQLEFDGELYEPTTITSFGRALELALDHFAAQPDAELDALALVDPAGQATLLARSRSIPAPAFATSVAAQIVEQARCTPDAIAVAGDGFELSYRACVDRALRLASWLRTRFGARPAESRIAICLERGIDLVPSMLAVLAAGMVHVPIDPRLPDVRRGTLIDRSAARLLITTSELASTLGDEVELLLVDRPGPWRDQAAIAPARVAPEQLAYLIYTSGSTGEPKGVAITQRGFAARMHWAITRHRSEELAGVLAASSVAFDLSVFEIFGPLCAGGTLILARDPLALVEHPQRARVRLVDTVPSAIAALLRTGGLPASVGWINLAGEALQRELVAALLASNPTRRVVNLYGPAEDTTFSTAAEVEGGSGPADLGESLPGSSAYLLDPALALAPERAIGELFLAGVGLARGYDRDPSATAARFLPDPFGEPGARMYRSGDRARRDSDGTLTYRGRRDRQLKLRGIRIEPGEIESTLARLEGMIEVAVVALPDARSPERLVALCRVGADATLDLEQIRVACAHELPRSHQPQILVVDALPRTASGKLDLAAIARLAGSLPSAARVIRPPTTRIETLLRECWAELLELPADRVSIDADVFSLGAHSLLVPALIARLQAELELRLPVRDVFEHPSVEQLARVIEAALAERDADLRALLDEVAGMSDDEVRQALAQFED